MPWRLSLQALPSNDTQRSILRSFLQRCGRSGLGAQPAAATENFCSLDGVHRLKPASTALLASVLLNASSHFSEFRVLRPDHFICILSRL